MTDSQSKLAALYGRCSTGQQEQLIQAQEGNMLRWANANGFIADESAIFLEDDTSGSIPFAERPKGAALLRLLEQGRHRHLVVPKIDRLGRSAMDVQNTIHTLREKLGVRVHIIDLGSHHFDTGHPPSGMIIAVLAYAAQMELDRIRERIKTVLDHKSSKGELIGTVPYGYDAVETGALTSKGVKIRRLVPNETERYWLRQMVLWRQQRLSYARIAWQPNQVRGSYQTRRRKYYSLPAQPPLAQWARCCYRGKMVMR
jgi:DNA invertase Pin-like site-specific DNA recombinase